MSNIEFQSEDMPVPQAHMFDPPAVRAAISAANSDPQKKHPYRDLEGRIHFISDEETIYMESNGKICTIHVAGQKPFSVRQTLISMQHPGFMHTRRDFMVNLSYIREIERNKVILLDDTELPLGKSKYLPLVQAMSE